MKAPKLIKFGLFKNTKGLTKKKTKIIWLLERFLNNVKPQ